MLIQHNLSIAILFKHLNICFFQRVDIINTLADLLERREDEILEANRKDLRAATQLEAPLRARLKLDSAKLRSLREGA